MIMVNKWQISTTMINQSMQNKTRLTLLVDYGISSGCSLLMVPRLPRASCISVDSPPWPMRLLKMGGMSSAELGQGPGNGEELLVEAAALMLEISCS